MASPCRARRWRIRPPLLLLTWYLLLTGATGENQPVFCEKNPCQNDGVCFEMNYAIEFGQPAISSSLKTTSVKSTTTAAPATTTAASTPSAAPPTLFAAQPASVAPYMTPAAISTPVTEPHTTPADSSTSPADPSPITTDHPTNAARSKTTTTSSTTAAPSTPPALEYTVGVLQPKEEAPLTLCPPPFHLTGGRCLQLTDVRVGAEDGRRLCRRLGGRMAAAGPDDALLLTRLLWPPPPRERLYAWVDGTAGHQGAQAYTPPRSGRRRRAPSRHLCTAAAADTGRLVLRHCAEPHRSLCERRPLAPRPRRSSRGEANAPRLGDTLGAEQTCHCKEGYGGEDCVSVDGNEGHEYVYCRGTTIGSRGQRIVVDFGALGRLPWEASNPPPDCPDVPLPPDSGSVGCTVPSSEAILRYWCQGKQECNIDFELLTAFGPISCNFENGYNTSMRLYLRHREELPSRVTQCRQGGTYHADTQTCYLVTTSPGYWQDQRGRCRGMGGDMAYTLPEDTYPGFNTFLQKLTADAGYTIDTIWVAGNASEPRPIEDMRPDWYSSGVYDCLPFNTGTIQTCSGSDRLYAVCALPPWSGAAAPDCPAVSFDEYGLTFAETAAGLTVSQQCRGNGYAGSATYVCGLNGQWSTPYPDLSGCHSESIDTDAVKNRLEQGDEPVSDIISELSNNVSARTTQQNQPLTSGDVINSVQLLPEMVKAQQAQLSEQGQSEEVVNQYLGNVTSLVSQLTRGEESWHAMPETDRSDTSTTLQANVEQSAYLLAEYLDNKHVDFNYDTIRLRTGRFSSLTGNLEYTTRQGSTVTLPDEVGRFNQSGKTSIVFVEYANMDCLLSDQKCSTPDELHKQTDLQYPFFVNSPLVSASAGNTSVTFKDSNVTLNFKTRLSASDFNLTNVQCVFWDESTGQWSTDGCHLGAVTNDSVECLCNHLTSFATLMDINGVIEEGSVLDLALSWLTTIGCVISLLSLAACLVVFTAIPALRSERTAVHRNLCFCLFTAELILLVGLQPYGNVVGCAIVAGLLHFFFLAAFAWMCIEGVQIYLMVYKVFATRKSYIRYFYCCGYGIPAVIVIISLSITKGEGYGTEAACWLSTENGLIWAFAGPLLIVVLVNILALVMALRVTARATKGRSTKAPPQASTWIRGSASLVAILGTTWLFGFLYFSNGLLFFSVVFTILNSLQGFFIFLFHVWLNDKNRAEAQRFMWKTTNRIGLTEHDLTSTSAGLTSRGHAGHTAETSVAGRVSSQGDTTVTGTGTGTGTGNDRPHKTNGAGNRIMRALQRVNGAHYSVKRINGEAKAENSASLEALRRLESQQPGGANA